MDGSPRGASGVAEVEVADRQGRPVDPARVAAAAAYTLEAEGCAQLLSVTLVDDDEMAELHVRFSGVAGPTDVLAFPLADDGGPPLPPELQLLGEVVVSTDTAAREAEARGHAFERELLLYVIHGTLHLLGYDDHEPSARARMHARQDALLEGFLGPPPN